MVSWDCSTCGGTGFEKVIEIRGGKMTEREDQCSRCLGSGSIRNGEPEWSSFKWGEWK